MGQDQNDGAPPEIPREAHQQAAQRTDAEVDAGTADHASAKSERDMHATAMPAEPPMERPLVPGYAIASSLGIAAPPTVQVKARPVWTVRLWLLSLLLMLGLSTLILAMPQRLLPLTVQGMPAQPAPVAPTIVTPDAPAASRPAAVARPDSLSVPSPATMAIVTTVPVPDVPRGEPRNRNADAAPAAAATLAAPSSPVADAACSAAMLAMNLCNKTSP